MWNINKSYPENTLFPLIIFLIGFLIDEDCWFQRNFGSVPSCSFVLCQCLSIFKLCYQKHKYLGLLWVDESILFSFKSFSYNILCLKVYFAHQYKHHFSSNQCWMEYLLLFFENFCVLTFSVFFFFFCKQHMLSLVLLIWHIFSLLRFNVIIITLLIQSIQVYKLAVCTNYHLFLYFPALRGSCLKKKTFRSLHNIYFRHTVLSFDK